MNLNEISEYLLSKPNAAEEYPFGPEPMVIKVMERCLH